MIVIGAGFGGIAVALRMRARGYDVTLLDRLSKIGGRAQVFERGGFRHDAGPTVITAPFLFDELSTSGFRRIENWMYRPSCNHCTECKSYRVDARNFSLTKSLKRIKKNNSEVSTLLKNNLICLVKI